MVLFVALALLPSVLAAWLLWAAPLDIVGRTALAARDLTLLHEAGALARAHDLTILYDPAALTAALRARYGPAMPAQIWPYPPVTLLLAAPLSLFGLPSAILLYIAVGIALIAASLRALPMTCRIAVLLSPALAETVLAGQNGALTTACLAGGLLMLDRRPLAAGGALGLLAIKPQLALLLPVCLLAGGRWRSLGACALTAALLVALSALLFGIDAWDHFFVDARAATAAQLAAPWQDSGQQRLFCSVLAAGRSLGATLTQAWTMQGSASLACAALCGRAWHRHGATRSTVALTLVASVVACPWVHAYDLPLTAVAIALIVLGARRSSFRTVVLAANWTWPGLATLTPLPNALSSLMLFLLLWIAASDCFALGLRTGERSPAW